MYIKDNLDPVALDKVKLGWDSGASVESLWFNIKATTREAFQLGIFYRPPTHNIVIETGICSEITRACSNNKKTLVIGDFNYAGIDWNISCGQSDTENSFIECLNDCYLSQIVTEPTRGKNILDLVLVNDEQFVTDVNIGEGLANSDHSIIRLLLGVSASKINNDRLVPNFARGDFTLFRNLLDINWEERFSDKNAYEMWDVLKTTLEDVQSKCVPYKKIRDSSSKKPLWWNGEIRKLLAAKNRLFKKFKKSSEFDDLELYKIARNMATREIRKSKRLGEIKLAKSSNKDPKRFFSYYKFNNKKQEKVGPLDHNGTLVGNDKDIVNVLNNYFSSVFTEENLNNFTFHIESQEIDRPPTLDISTIKKNILKLKDRKASGPDELSVRILKEGGDSIAMALYFIFTRSLEFGEIPTDWRLANITPIFKKGDKKLVQNYRPISLTSLVVKVFEKIIKDQIEVYLEANSIIKNSQHGFRSGRSCLTNLLSFLDYITDQVDRGEDIDLVYLDFSKAFDKVPHKRLVYKLREYRLNSFIVNWVENWLTDRKQRVVLNGNRSGWMDVKSGVPQGSVLGPLLFIIYINDIDSGLSSRVSKFADDTKLAAKAGKWEDASMLQRDIDKLISWADKWQMEFNVSKCKVLHIGKNNSNFSYTMGDKWLDASDSERDLGVVVNNDLKVHKQCLEARNRANKMLGIINRNVSYKSKEVICKLYNSYVRPHLEYCIQAWKPHHRGDLNMLEKVQRRATKMIPSLKNLSYEDRLRELGMFSFERRCNRGDLIEVYKMFTGIDTLDVLNFFELDTSDRTRGHNFKIRKQQSRLDIRKHFFTNRVVDAWNDLPHEVVNSATLDTFKNRLDKHMSACEMM